MPETTTSFEYLLQRRTRLIMPLVRVTWNYMAKDGWRRSAGRSSLPAIDVRIRMGGWIPI
jgi:hypothetical protein